MSKKEDPPARFDAGDGVSFRRGGGIRHPGRVLVPRDRVQIGVAPDPAAGVCDRVDRCPLP